VDCGADDAVVYNELQPRINRGGAELLIVLLGDRPRSGLKLVEDVQAKGGLPILVVGPSHDAQIIMQAMHAGARDYLDIERVRENLAKTLEKLRQTGAIQFRRGRSIVVTSAMPGSGATTIATGMAFALGSTHPNQVVLGEVGVGVPELALDLDLQPTNHVSQLLNDWDRVDATTVRQTAVAHPGGIYVLADTGNGTRADFNNTTASRQLTSLLRTMYDYAIYDVGHSQTVAAENLIRHADRVVLVVRLDVPSLRITRNLLNRFTDWGVARERLTIVANRYGQRGQLGWRRMEESLGVTVDVWMPDDPATVNQALNLGVPVTQVSSWGKLIRRLHELAQQVNGVAK
jgi:pilus assembly protein CpaE